MTPPPVVDLLREIASECRYDRPAIWEHEVAILALADSLSEITPERVEALRYVAMTHHMNYDMETDFDECEDCADRRVALAALSRISSGEARP